ncbi:cytochrome c family protein [Rhodobium gokarnense]|uniref:Cytochrome c peroxidase n=1 Tax=Rhodobium gokarnense TaxID=364296 RepID=A0ABT3HGS1_9HYPH|nr:di-heme oxidoredictase family protein [Rhodobium gokarnense]MCW2309610.1 cytochrome c peroxidase [Rhodobium gokarnense]
MKKDDGNAMGRIGRCALLAAVAVCLAAAARAEEPVWIEKAMPAHLGLQSVTGALDGDRLKTVVEHGKILFEARFTVHDGAGRPAATQAIIPTKKKRPVRETFARTFGPDANACTSCHNVPEPGGAGDFTANVFVSEGFESADFDSTAPQFSNERGTPHLFGSGLLELLAREMTADLKAQRHAALLAARRSGEPVTVALATKGVDFGRLTASPDGAVDVSEFDGVDTDLVIRPFSQKGVFASLRQFTINALNQHHGIQPDERFGTRWTGTEDFDEDGVLSEMSAGDVSAFVAFQATLPPPEQKTPESGAWQAAAKKGETVFTDIGCAECHRPTLPLNSLIFDDPGPNDTAGTLRQGDVAAPGAIDLAQLPFARHLKRDERGAWLIPVFGDLKRHRIADNQVDHFANELLAQRFVEADVFLTAELWGIADTAPYGHRGDLTTLDETIRAHGGAGRAARDAYVALSDEERGSLIAFLKTLGIAR